MFKFIYFLLSSSLLKKVFSQKGLLTDSLLISSSFYFPRAKENNPARTLTSECPEGFKYDLNNGCTRCPVTFCAFCPFQYCERCLKGYTWEDYWKCSKCEDPNCSTCKAGNTEDCQECISGYTLHRNQCILCNKTEECNLCIEENLCVSCNLNFFLNSKELRCVSCYTKNCEDCPGGVNCLKCQPGFFLNNRKECEKVCLVEFCLECKNMNETDLCSACQSGYFLNILENKCEKCLAPNCKQCSNSTKLCESCLDNFFLVEDLRTCQPCVTGCKHCSVNNNNCSECSDGFALVEVNKCQPCRIRNCAKCSNPGMCSACKKGYFLENPGYQCKPCPNGCEECVGEICLTCNARRIMKLSEMSCKECVPNCDENFCNDDGLCLFCKEGILN